MPSRRWRRGDLTEASRALAFNRKIADQIVAGNPAGDATAGLILANEEVESNIAGAAAQRIFEFNERKAAVSVADRALAQDAFGRAWAWHLRADDLGKSRAFDYEPHARILNLKLSEGRFQFQTGDKAAAARSFLQTGRGTCTSGAWDSLSELCQLAVAFYFDAIGKKDISIGEGLPEFRRQIAKLPVQKHAPKE